MSQSTSQNDPSSADLTPEAKRRRLAALLQRKKADAATHPLSFAQERLWFLEQLEPGNAAYHVATALRFEGTLNVDALEQSLNDVVARHDVLRARFILNGDAPVQVIDRERPLRLDTVDVASLLDAQAAGPAHGDGAAGIPPASPDAANVASAPTAWRDAVTAYAREEAHRPFDLEHGPLLRATLVHVGPDDAVVLLTMHHIVSDGWSLGVLVREVAEGYAAHAGDGAATTRALPIQYPDYVRWQRKTLAGERLDDLLTHWNETLSDAPTTLDLPIDRPRPPVQTFTGNTVRFHVPEDVVARLLDVAQGEKATRFMAFLAGFYAFLQRYTGQDDLVVGSPVAQRDRVETEPLIGFFTNTLVFRTKLGGDPSFREILSRVRRTALDAYAHQDVPFARLVESLLPNRDLSHQALFQVMFGMQDATVDTLALPGLDVTPVDVDYGVAPFDLNVNLEENGAGLDGSVTYNADLFDAATVDRAMRLYVRLLGAVADRPDAPLSTLSLLGEADADALAAWNDTATPLPHAATLPALFDAQAARTPDADALTADGETLSYADLDARVTRLARRLRRHGVGPETRVGLCLNRSLDLVVAVWAVLKAGGAFVPLDPAYPEARIDLVLDDAGIAVLLTDADTHARFADAAATPTALRVDATDVLDASPATADSETLPPVDVHADHLAYVIYTSGSTGRPKGVMVTHANAVNFFAGMDAVVDPESDLKSGTDDAVTWLATTSISFDISVLELLWTLTRGAHAVVYTPPEADVRVGVDHAALRRVEADVKPVELGLFYFADDAAENESDGSPGHRYRLLLDGARFADTHGFSAVWTPERHFHSFGGLYPNPSVTGAAIATATDTVRVRAGSVVLPLHHPVRVAEEWAVVDNLSGGRVDLSFASGWHENDFLFAPQNYATRRDLLPEQIDIVRRLWRGEEVTFDGVDGNPVTVGIHPRPVQSELPVWLTAAGNPATFEQAGAMGASLLTHLLGQDVDTLSEKIGLYRAARRDAGHAGPGHVSLMLHTFVGTDRDAVLEAVRAPFMNYLRSSVSLVRALADDVPTELLEGASAEEELEVLLNLAFDRYVDTSSLIGTVDDGLATLDRLRAAGVDEIACLVDFGMPTDVALDGLDTLATLRQRHADGERGAAASETSGPSVASTASSTPHAGSTPHADPSRVATLVREYGATHLQCTPSMAAQLAGDPDALGALTGLRTLLIGGEAFPDALADTLRDALPSTRIVNMYGPTETTVWSSTHAVDDARPVPIGRPIANTALHVVGASGRRVPVGVSGELWIGGEGVARGYLQRPALTAERFVPDAFGAEPGARLYRTGDRTRWRNDGTMRFLGRTDHQVKVRGHRIEPGEIEAALEAHPGVDRAVVTVHGTGAEQRLVAYCTAPGDEMSGEVSGRASGETLPVYRLPNGLTVHHQHDHITSGLYTEIFEDRIYTRHGVTLDDGAVVVDVGANIGMFSLYAHYAARDVRVVSVEPMPPTNAVLTANAARHGLDATVLRCGLAAEPGRDAFTFYPHSTGLSGRHAIPERDRSIARHMIAEELKRQVPDPSAVPDAEIERVLDERFTTETFSCELRTLSDVIADEALDRIDLLKVDVERGEFDVIAGLRDADWARVRQVVLELDTDDLLDRCTALLERHGFACLAEPYVEVGRSDDGDALHVYMLYAARPSERTLTRDGGPPTTPLRLNDAPDVSGASDPAFSMASDAASDAGAARPTTTALRRHLTERLPAYMVPSAFVPLDALPLTPNGKVDRKQLPDPTTHQAELDVAFVAPSDGLESTIGAVWRRVLKLDRVGVHDNFFERGGTSLLMALVHQQLRDAVAVEVSLVDLFHYPTIRSLADALDARQASDAATPDRSDAARSRAEKQAAARRRRRRS